MNRNLLKNKDFSLLMVATFISTVGTIVQNTALSLYVLDTTQSSVKFASVLVLSSLPQLILGPFCGVISDWVDRKKFMVILNIISAMVIIVPTILLFNNKITLSVIYAIVITLGFIMAFYSPTSAGVVRIIVKDKNLSNAYAINSLIDSIEYMIAPMIGAIVYSLFGLKIIFLLNGLSFILAAILQFKIHIPLKKETIDKLSFKKFNSDFIQGITYIFNNKNLWYLAVTIMLFNFFSAPLFSVGTGYIAKLQFKVSNEQFSLIETIGVIASFMGPFLYAFTKNKISLQKLFQLSIFISAILILLISLISTNFINNLFGSYVLYLILFFIISLVEGPLNIAIMTLIQNSIDIEYIGRSNGIITTMFIGLVPLGQLFYGMLFDYMYIAIPYVISAIAYIALIMFYRRKCMLLRKHNIE
ncbi:MFS transporter [Paraclostridium bifermentans]|uniref:MFS transporter n=1 Tax=Paraclostridium bifermentans TaxID=1490 RepID=UPI00038C9AE7|nr:MFS transporter [Paraclostridium bifermentans]EQK46816.1 major Facilitator Superfamily protein [[Clostridium] bifermentans ATCC 19299] [Paraclostridium bifermentans ATCC 19299]MCE9675084.1 MFS transporter [Paraclostridium bifermentans]